VCPFAAAAARRDTFLLFFRACRAFPAREKEFKKKKKKEHTLFHQQQQQPAATMAACAGGGGGTTDGACGGGWLAAGVSGQRQALEQWERREAAIRETVGGMWSEHASAFAAYWRQELHDQPEVRAAMFLAALQDLLSPDDDDDDSDNVRQGQQQQQQLGSLVEGACPELQDMPQLLTSPDALLALLTEPHAYHQQRHLDAQEPPAPAPAPAPADGEEQPAGAIDVGREALNVARRCCLLQLGCNLLLLFLTGEQEEGTV
jgi:hypothetical protein